MNYHTGHVVARRVIVHLRDNIHVYNNGDENTYVEVSDDGWVHVKPLAPGASISLMYFTDED